MITSTQNKMKDTLKDDINMIWPKLERKFDRAYTQVWVGIPQFTLTNKKIGFGLVWHQPAQLKNDSRMVSCKQSGYVALFHIGQF